MPKTVIIAGIGMGNERLLTQEVKAAMEEAQVLLGGERMLALCKKICAATQETAFFQSYLPKEILERIEQGAEERYCILMSGDSGFYSGTKKLLPHLKKQGYEVSLYPGISSLSYLCAAFGRDYNNVYLASLHGKSENIAYAVRTHKQVFVLMQGQGAELAAHLTEYGLGKARLLVGVDLSYPNEQLFSCLAKDYPQQDSCKKQLLSILIENEEAINGRNSFQDEDFVRGEVPMTKEAVRNQVGALFTVKEDAIVYDIGAGTGSLSVTLGAKVPRGRVYAIECNKEALSLIEKNKRRHGMDHIITVPGMAPGVLEGLPVPEAVFIGGSKGNLKEILQSLKNSKKQQDILVVITAITLETVAKLLSLEKEGFLQKMQLMQLQNAAMVPLGSLHKLEPENPIWIVRGYV